MPSLLFNVYKHLYFFQDIKRPKKSKEKLISPKEISGSNIKTSAQVSKKKKTPSPSEKVNKKEVNKNTSPQVEDIADMSNTNEDLTQQKVGCDLT